MKIKYCLVWLALVIVLCGPNQECPAQSKGLDWLTQEERDWLSAHPVIRVAPTPAYPPFEYWSEEGKFQGIVSSYLSHFEDVLGVRFEMVQTEKWSENLQMLRDRDIDAVSLIVPWTNRDFVQVSKPYISYPSMIIVRSSETRDLTLKDLIGKRVAVPVGYTGESFLRQNHPEILIVKADDPADGIRMLTAGEVDAFFGGSAVVAYMAQREGITNLRIASESDFKYRNGFGVRDDWGIFADIISKTLDRVTPAQDSEFHASWVTEGFFKKRFYESTRFWWTLCSVASVLLIGTFVMAIWNRKQAALIDQLEVEKQRTEEARLEAENANQAKRDFVATISHEIRTPMHGVLGMCELLRSTGLDEKQNEYLGFASGSAQNLVGLVDDLLDFSKMEAGKLELEERPFALGNLLDDLIALMELQSNPKGLRLVDTRDQRLAKHYVGDSLRVRQVLLNFLSNAIKFTNKGEIQIKSTLESENENSHLIRFEVKDSGIGIEADQLARVFEPFEQEKSETTRRFGGTGLGLSICKSLAGMMGGSASVQSTPGVGSVFSFSVRVVPTDEPELEKYPEPKLLETTEKRTILLAEDGLVNQKVASGLLERRGHHVEIVENGKDALAAMLANRFDAVLMDIEMPEMDGMEAIKSLREREQDDVHQWVVAVTGHAMTGDRERFLAAGFDEHLVKPFLPDQLYAVVEQVNV